MMRKRSDGENGGVRRRHLRFWGILFGIPVFLLLLYGCWWIYAESRMDAALARARADGWAVTAEELRRTVHTATPEEVARWLRLYDDWSCAVGGVPSQTISGVHAWAGTVGKDWAAAADRMSNGSELLEKLLAYEAVPVAYNLENPAETLFPHLSPLRGLSQFLAGQFRLAAADGDAARALELWREGRRVENLLNGDVTLIGSLVATNLEVIWINALKAAALTGELRCFSDAQLREMVASLEAVPVAELYRRCAGMDICWMEALTSWRGRESWREYFDQMGLSDMIGRECLWMVLCSYSPYGRIQGVETVEYIRRIYALVGSDWYEIQSAMPEFSPGWRERPVLWKHIEIGNPEKASNRLMALRRTFRCGIALELYRRKFGHFPEKLEDLVTAGLLDAVPVDPFDGKPLRYSVGPHSFEWRKAVADKPEPEVTTVKLNAATVWSIGRNCVDDGGMDGLGAKGDVVFAVADGVGKGENHDEK